MVLANFNQGQKYSTVANLKMVGIVSKMIPAHWRPQTMYTAENINRVRAIIEEDPNATHDITEAVASINHFIIN